MADIVFGEIEGFGEGYHFDDRKSMMERAFHRKWAAGIDGNGKEGTAAIVLSGGYEDDEDFGDIITYTGAGGNKDGRQVEDQSWDNLGNAGLVVSMNKGLPVRVVRGHNHRSAYSPKKGYLYAGLYSVADRWEDIGKSGYKVCKFKLVYAGSNYDALKNTRQNALNESPLPPIEEVKVSLASKPLIKPKARKSRVRNNDTSANYYDAKKATPHGNQGERLLIT